MTPTTTVNLMKAYCKMTGKYAMFISFYVPSPDEKDSYDIEELFKAAPYLKIMRRNDEMMQIIADESGVLIFSTEAEMLRYFEMTVGDDGPTKRNKYNGRARVYALTCGPEGLLSENT